MGTLSVGEKTQELISMFPELDEQLTLLGVICPVGFAQYVRAVAFSLRNLPTDQRTKEVLGLVLIEHADILCES